MRQGVGQQALIAVAVVLGVIATLSIGFILAQTDSAARVGDITPGTDELPTPTLLLLNTVTPTPTSAILEEAELPTDEPLPTVTSASTTCSPPPSWRPIIVSATDTLSSLAADFDITDDLLMEGNCLEDPALQAGQTLYVPAQPTQEPQQPQQPTATEEGCKPASGWKTYTVQAGENLFRIGLRHGQTVDGMLKANCLTSVNIKAGQKILVPPVTPLPPTPIRQSPATATPDPNQTPTLVPGCTNPGAQITSPAAGSVLVDDVLFYGTAAADEDVFKFYKLEIRPTDGNWEFVTFTDARAKSPVINGLLGQVGAYAFPPGRYVIRLSVVDNTSSVVAECSIKVTLEGGPSATATK
jgi:LysM repeat protein